MQAQFITEDTAIGVTFSGFGSDAGRTFDNTTDLYGKSARSFGITYMRPISKRFDVEIGIEFGRMEFGDNIRNNNTSYTWDIIEVPVTLRFNFYRFFFLNGGLSLDTNGLFNNDEFAHLRSSRPLSLGMMLGAGAKYDFKNKPIGVFINPFYRYRTLPYFGQIEVRKRIRNTLENGFRVGAIYRF
jgi:opacity protein-like surface antigen